MDKYRNTFTELPSISSLALLPSIYFLN